MSEPKPKDIVEGILHEDTQVEGDTLHLTVSRIEEVVKPGRVDFGGGELEEAELEEREKYWRNDDDTYQWWYLPAGQYLVSYNETLPASNAQAFLLQTREEVLRRGGFHPSRYVTTLPQMPLMVGEGGIHLKENARISVLIPPP